MTATGTTTTSLTGECQYCTGTIHSGQCPKIKAVEYFPNGSVKRIEFHPPNAWYPQPYVAPVPYITPTTVPWTQTAPVPKTTYGTICNLVGEGGSTCMFYMD